MAAALSGVDERALVHAQTLIRLRRWEDARRCLANLLATEPGCVEAWCLLARASNGLGDYPAMARAAQAALAVDPTSDWAQRLRSIALAEQGQHAEAVASAREAVRLAPKDWRANVALASALIGLTERRTEALDWARRAVGLAPDQPDTHFTMGLVTAELGRLAEADRSFRAALALRPDHAAAINNLALLELRRGRMASAASGFGAAVASDPTSHIARRNVDAIGWALLHRAHVGAFFMLLGVGLVPAVAVGPRTPLAGAMVVLVLAGVWTVLIGRTFTGMSPTVRRYLYSRPRHDPLFGVMATGLVVCLGCTASAVLLPSGAALPVLTVGFVGLLAGFLASAARYLRGRAVRRR